MGQKIRIILFYLSIATFFILLPTILLYSFGYKLDIKKFRIAKTGLIYVKTIPDGAKIYLNGKNLKKTTPFSIEGLIPGNYSLLLQSQDYSSWQQVVPVKSGETTALDNIVLFPKKPYLDKINIMDIGSFYIYEQDSDYAYCISEDRLSMYKVSLNTKDQHVTLLCDYLEFPSASKEFLLSPDKGKVIFFNDDRLDVLYLPTDKFNYQQAKEKHFFVKADGRILHAFWFSDSGRIIVITDKTVAVYELFSRGTSNTITLLKLRDSRTKAFYDTAGDMLYFTDIQRGSDDQWHKGLYRLDLSKRSPFIFIKNIEDNLR